MTSAISSFGTLMKIGDGATPTETFTTIAEVLDITGPQVALATTEVTSHDSNGWREFIPTLKEGGEVTFDCNFFAHTTQGFSGGLYNDLNNKTKRNFQTVFTTTPAKTAAYAAYVTSVKLAAPVDGALKGSITLKITGAVSWS